MGGGLSQGRHLLLIGCVCIAAALGLPSVAHGITFGPTVGDLGPEETVFDHSANDGSLLEACEEWDIPDQPARAFRDNLSRVQLHFSHHDARRNIALDGDLNTASSAGHHDCAFPINSNRNADPSQYDDLSWIASPYTLDGKTVYSLVHEEWRGPNHLACTPAGDDYTVCWYNAITLSVSNDSGDHFTHRPTPQHLVAALPDRWDASLPPRGPYGIFTPSNVISTGANNIPYRPGDGNTSYYYAMVRQKEPGAPDVSCLMRTRDLSDPSSWRAWGDGPDPDSTDSFEVQFVNPYTYQFTASDPREKHLCKDVGGNLVTGVTESLTYNTYFGKFLLVGAYGNPVPGFYYSLSDDLINWSAPKLLLAAETTHAYQCGDPDPVRDPSVLDPSSSSKNFETTGRRPYIYYKIFNLNGGCSFGPDRDQLRVRFEFDPPNASFTISPNPADEGQSVSFDGSASSYPGGRIPKYKWDLDGNGTFETDTGSTPTTSRTYTTDGTVTVTLQVTSDFGSTRETSGTLTIGRNSGPPSGGSSTPSSNAQPAGVQISSTPQACKRVTSPERGRLAGLLKTARRKLARAKGKAAVRRLRRQIMRLDRKLKRLPGPMCEKKCSRQRARLNRLLRTARRKLARAQTLPAKQRYSRQVKSLKKRLKRLPPCRR